MKLLQAPNLKTRALTKVMYTAIHSFDESTFDNISEKSEKKNFLVKKSSQPVPNPSQGMVGPQAKIMATSDPARLPRRDIKTPKSETAEDAPEKGYH